MDIEWQGDGIDEIGIDRNSGKQIIAVDSRYFRPTEVETLLGDPSKAKKHPRVGSNDTVFGIGQGDGCG